MCNTTGKYEDCWKCGGIGNLDVFSHVAKGVCFACKGTGKMLAGKPVAAKNSLARAFVVDGYVWEFEPVHHGEDAHYTAKKGDRVDTVILQSYKAGDNRRKGTTILRCRVAPEIARKVWHDAKQGLKPETATNAYLGGFKNGYGKDIGPEFQTGSCACTRNGRGIDPII